MQSKRLTSIAADTSELIGETPMVWLRHNDPTVVAKIALKLESENPLGSVKDRLALGIVTMAEADGLIKPGVSTLIEATSGNTGIGLALMGALRGYKVIIIMDESCSLERRAVLRAFGVDLRLYPKTQTMVFGVAYAEFLTKQIPNSYLCRQFATEYNARIHRETTGPEIWSQTNGDVDYFVAGLGTSGTMAGISQFFQSKGSSCKMIAVEPQESPVSSQGPKAAGPHGIQGIGPSFTPQVLQGNRHLIHEFIGVHTKAALDMARQLPVMSGVFCGISGGAAVSAAMMLGRRAEAKGKTIVVLIPSYGERYLSTALFESVKKECDELALPQNLIPLDFATKGFEKSKL